MKPLTFVAILLLINSSLISQVRIKFHFISQCDNKIDNLAFAAYTIGSSIYAATPDSVLKIEPGFYRLTYNGRINGDPIDWSEDLFVSNTSHSDTTVSIPALLRTVRHNNSTNQSFTYYYCDKLANGLIIDKYPNGNVRLKGNFKNGKALSKIEQFDINRSLYPE